MTALELSNRRLGDLDPPQRPATALDIDPTLENRRAFWSTDDSALKCPFGGANPSPQQTERGQIQAIEIPATEVPITHVLATQVSSSHGQYDAADSGRVRLPGTGRPAKGINRSIQDPDA
ncbi:MAG TPA: hypothetical protein VKZ53_26795 [Candidatus Angelobacter sp.]|nr:hypothetical protein [Candidatus Angelobacter sp.]